MYVIAITIFVGLFVAGLLRHLRLRSELKSARETIASQDEQLRVERLRSDKPWQEMFQKVMSLFAKLRIERSRIEQAMQAEGLSQDELETHWFQIGEMDDQLAAMEADISLLKDGYMPPSAATPFRPQA